MSTKYILVGRKAVVEPNLFKWAEWFEKAPDRHIANDEIGLYRVSTVFLGIDHQFGNGPPLIFETMIFGPPDDGEYQTRASTWEEAQDQHEAACEHARKNMQRGPLTPTPSRS